MSNSNFRKLQIQAIENYLKNSNCKPLKKEQSKEKKEIINLDLNESEINLISEALETLYNNTIGEMLFNKESQILDLSNKFKNI